MRFSGIDESLKLTLTRVQVLHSVRLAAQSAPATKDMNFIPAPSLASQQASPAQAASTGLARDELLLRVCMCSRHKPDKLLQVTAPMMLGSSKIHHANSILQGCSALWSATSVECVWVAYARSQRESGGRGDGCTLA